MTHPLPLAVPGTRAEVVLDTTGSGVIRTDAGTFLRLESPPEDLAELLTSGAVDSRTSDATPKATYLDTLSETIGSRESRDAEQRWPARKRQIALVGTAPLLDELAQMLAPWQVAAVRYDSAEDCCARAEPGSLVIGYANAPSQREGWDALDALPARGITWLRAYREGSSSFVDPISLTTQDTTSAQVRRRRVAASLVPQHLERWLETTTQESEASQIERTLITARLLTMALNWAHESEHLHTHRVTLWKLTAATGAISEHTVLPYPPVAPRATARRS